MNIFFDDITITQTHSQILAVYEYYPFGMAWNNPLNQLDVPVNKYLYNGIEFQEELRLGTYMADFRMYDPVIGRWWQQDPIIKENMSPYAWVTNNPLRYADPFGLDYINHKDLIWPEFNPEQDVVVLDEVTAESTYTGPKPEDSSNIVRAQQIMYQQNNPAPLATGAIEFDAMTQLSLGFLGSNLLRGASAFVTRPALTQAAQEGTYSVYLLVDNAGKVRYIGITSMTAQMRLTEHLMDPAKVGLRVGKEFGGILTLEGAKKMEQELILKHWGPDLLNKINSIAPKHWPAYGRSP